MEEKARERGVGQRSLFFNGFPARNQSPSTRNRNPCISLSDFLNRKLQTTSATPSRTVQSKLKPFGSSLDHTSVRVGVKRGVEERDGLIQDDAFQMFKCPRKQVLDGSLSVEAKPTDARDFGITSSGVSSTVESRKPTPPYVLALGDDGNCSQNSRQVCCSEGNKPKPVFDHYANGGGWWDCDMEGLDSGVVCNEVWEGMGSTTLGGLDWH